MMLCVSAMNAKQEYIRNKKTILSVKCGTMPKTESASKAKVERNAVQWAGEHRRVLWLSAFLIFKSNYKLNKFTIMSAWTKQELESMLEDVITVLDLSESMLEKHGAISTPPAELVRLVMERKDNEIRMLKIGMKPIE